MTCFSVTGPHIISIQKCTAFARNPFWRWLISKISLRYNRGGSEMFLFKSQKKLFENFFANISSTFQNLFFKNVKKKKTFITLFSQLVFKIILSTFWKLFPNVFFFSNKWSNCLNFFPSPYFFFSILQNVFSKKINSNLSKLFSKVFFHTGSERRGERRKGEENREA